VKFAYVPVLLGGIFKLTNNRSPGESLAGIKNKPQYMELETERFIHRHNITAFRKSPFFPVNTLQLMRGAVAAQFEGMFEPYFHAAYHHMWEEPKKMDDPQVAREAFISSNIDFDRLFARAQQRDVKDRLLELTQQAVDRGAFGSPTFFVGRDMFFGKNQLHDVEEAIVEANTPAQNELKKSRA
jgi:2-hydroxychromene-2-carboxylate isomerase